MFDFFENLFRFEWNLQKKIRFWLKKNRKNRAKSKSFQNLTKIKIYPKNLIFFENFDRTRNFSEIFTQIEIFEIIKIIEIFL